MLTRRTLADSRTVVWCYALASLQPNAPGRAGQGAAGQPSFGVTLSGPSAPAKRTGNTLSGGKAAAESLSPPRLGVTFSPVRCYAFPG